MSTIARSDIRICGPGQCWVCSILSGSSKTIKIFFFDLALQFFFFKFSYSFNFQFPTWISLVNSPIPNSPAINIKIYMVIFHQEKIGINKDKCQKYIPGLPAKDWEGEHCLHFSREGEITLVQHCYHHRRHNCRSSPSFPSSACSLSQL